MSQLAAALGALRLPAGAPVALFLERSAEWVVAMLASLASGHPFVPMEPSVPQGRAVWYLQDARPALVLCAAGAESSQRAQQLLAAAGDAGEQVPIMQVGESSCRVGEAMERQLWEGIRKAEGWGRQRSGSCGQGRGLKVGGTSRGRSGKAGVGRVNRSQAVVWAFRRSDGALARVCLGFEDSPRHRHLGSGGASE